MVLHLEIMYHFQAFTDFQRAYEGIQWTDIAMMVTSSPT